MGLSVMQTIQPASTTLRYLSSKVWRSFSMSSDERLGVWSSTLKILSIESPQPHQGVDAFELEDVLETGQRRMAGRQDLVLAHGRADDRVQAERHGQGQEGALERPFDRLPALRLRRQHDREIAQADGHVDAVEKGIGVDEGERFKDPLEL